MPRIITVGAAQLGPIARNDTRAQVVERMLALMHDGQGAAAAIWSCFRNWR